MLIALWFLIMFLGLIFYLRDNWSRYFLEIEIIITIIESLAISVGIKYYWALCLRLMGLKRIG